MLQKYNIEVLYFYLHNKLHFSIYTENEIWELEKLNQKSKSIVNQNNTLITFIFLVREAMLVTQSKTQLNQ